MVAMTPERRSHRVRVATRAVSMLTVPRVNCGALGSNLANVYRMNDHGRLSTQAKRMSILAAPVRNEVRGAFVGRERKEKARDDAIHVVGA